MTTTIDVDVTPVEKSGSIVICDIDRKPGGGGGNCVTDGVLFLPQEQAPFAINFNLKNGPLGQYSWDSDPCWAQRSRCPNSSGMPPQFPSCSTNGGTLTVNANGVNGKSAVHFRFNMKDPNGNSVFCDPVIINN
jgi:hypothetical protein